MGGIALAAGAEFALGAGAIGLPAASAAASKVPFKDFQEWGRSAVGWGQRASGAAQAMSDMTAQKAATLDPAKVRAAQAFYQNAVASNKGADAAAARVELMKRILELQKK